MSFKLSKSQLEKLRQLDPEEALAEANRLREAFNARLRKKRAADPEKYREKRRRAYARKKAKYRALNRRYEQEARADPARLKAMQERWKRNRKPFFNRDKEKDRLQKQRARQRYKTQLLARTDPASLRKIIKAHVPGYLVSSAQMDVINAVMVQALDAKVPFNDLAAWVKKAVTDHNRQFDHFKNVSIDAPIAGTDGLTRADLLDSETFHF